MKLMNQTTYRKLQIYILHLQEDLSQYLSKEQNILIDKIIIIMHIITVLQKLTETEVK